jgi:hypothetical protein
MRATRSFGKVVLLGLLAACRDIALPAAELRMQGNFACRGNLGRVTKNKIVVPSGATCTLNGSRAEDIALVQERFTCERRHSTARVGCKTNPEPFGKTASRRSL